MMNLGGFIVVTKCPMHLSHVMLWLRGSAICLLQSGTKHKYICKEPYIWGIQNDFILLNIFLVLYKFGFCSGLIFVFINAGYYIKTQTHKNMPNVVCARGHVAISAALKKKKKSPLVTKNLLWFTFTA